MLWAQIAGLCLVLLGSMMIAIRTAKGRPAEAPESSATAITTGVFVLLFKFCIWAFAGGFDKIIGWPN